MTDRRHTRAARVAAITAVAAIVALTAAVPASARRRASSRQVAALTKAVHASPVGGLRRIPTSHYRVTDMQISTVSKSWASAEVRPTARYRDSLQAVAVVAVQPATTSSWVVVDLGSAQVGCGIAPDKVLADLARTKVSEVCAGGGVG